MRYKSLGLALGLVSLMVGATPVLSTSASLQATLPAVPKKQLKAVKRQKTAASEAAPRYRRSKNPPTKRKLRANRLHTSKRVRRRHRRAGKRAA